MENVLKAAHLLAPMYHGSNTLYKDDQELTGFEKKNISLRINGVQYCPSMQQLINITGKQFRQ